MTTPNTTTEAPNVGGRPSKLTPDIIERMSGHFLEGGHPELVCSLVGVSRRCYYYWLEDGEADLENDRDTLHAEFCLRTKKALALCESDAVKRMKAGGKDWMGAAEFLARRFPSRWRRNIAASDEDRRLHRRYMPVVEGP